LKEAGKSTGKKRRGKPRRFCFLVDEINNLVHIPRRAELKVGPYTPLPGSGDFPVAVDA
jgi:hypothetical protein